jgi:nucleoside-diphosphate-sugar epimerase
MASKKLAITSASSFTALWIARALHDAGWEVHALCQSERGRYTGLRAHRVAWLEKWSRVHYSVGVEDDAMKAWIEKERPAIWVHHHHFMEDFRSPKYDLERARKFGLKPLPELVATLARSGCKGLVYSGSYFEPGERGAVPQPTPYARSKQEVWTALEELCAREKLGLSKVVIPNPIGPFENEDRLIPKLIEAAQARTKFPVTAPHASGDQLPVERLAQIYLRAAEELVLGKPRIFRPSGWVVEVLQFVNTINRELVEKRLKLAPAALDIAKVEAPKANGPQAADGSEPCSPPIDWKAVWDFYSGWLNKKL